MYTFEGDIVNPVIRRNSRTQQPQSGTYKSRMEAIVTRCMKAAKSFLDTFLTIPASEYPFLATHQWHAQVYATVMLYKLSLGLSRLPSWDVSVARSYVSLEDYIDQLCKTMVFSRRGIGDGGTVARKSLYVLQDTIWRDVQKEFVRRRDLPLDKRLASSAKAVHRAILEIDGNHLETSESTSETREPNVEKNRSAHPCPAYIYWKG
jgi:hypothetical protein